MIEELQKSNKGQKILAEKPPRQHQENCKLESTRSGQNTCILVQKVHDTTQNLKPANMYPNFCQFGSVVPEKNETDKQTDKPTKAYSGEQKPILG